MVTYRNKRSNLQEARSESLYAVVTNAIALIKWRAEGSVAERIKHEVRRYSAIARRELESGGKQIN